MNHGVTVILTNPFSGRVLGASDSHYGKPSNLIARGRAANMGEGWETGRPLSLT